MMVGVAPKGISVGQWWMLNEKATIQKIRIVQKEGKREVSRELDHYNLDMIISDGYIINKDELHAA